MMSGKSRDRGPVVRIKRYPQGRFYCLDRLHYITRNDIVAMAQRGEAFMVIDATTGEDVSMSFRPITVGH
jgi:polyhydroxyalkanoate synthesis regulator protein